MMIAAKSDNYYELIELLFVRKEKIYPKIDFLIVDLNIFILYL